MKKKSIMKFCAVALTVAMMATMVACGGNDDGSSTPSSSTPSSSTPSSTPEETTPSTEEGETYDFGGQELKVWGAYWGNLNPESSDYAKYSDIAKTVEEKYNVKFVYSEPDGYDGYNLHELIIAGITNGNGVLDIAGIDPVGLSALIAGGYLADITDSYEQLELGSLYTEAATWQGHVYGFTHDNIGDTHMLIYSRDYLNDIGMEETPTDKFMKGEWDYDSFKAYLTEMKAKLPDGIYPIGQHYFQWISMAGAANGVIDIDSDGNINFDDEHYIEAMELYVDLQNLGLAEPMVPTDNGDGTYSSSFTTGTDAIAHGGQGTYVMTCVELWQLSGMADSIGQFGIVPWPWGSNVTIGQSGTKGDYKTLDDNYKTAHLYWTPTVVMSDAAARTGIDNATLFKIALDYYEACDPVRFAAYHEAYQAEQSGQQPVIGFEAGTARNFCTEDDIEVYDWMHTRVEYSWSKPMNDGGYVNTWELAKRSIAVKLDARAQAESYKQEGLAALRDAKLIQ